jgi:hypothetical protein
MIECWRVSLSSHRPLGGGGVLRDGRCNYWVGKGEYFRTVRGGILYYH